MNTAAKGNGTQPGHRYVPDRTSPTQVTNREKSGEAEQ